MSFSATELEHRALIEVSGADARSFLQNLITTDLDDLAQDTAGFGALLTPQGKILFDFFVVPLPPKMAPAEPQGYVLDAHADSAKALFQRLSLYKLRADINLTDRSDELMVLALYGHDDKAVIDDLPGHVVADPRHDGLGFRAYITRSGEGVAWADLDVVSADMTHYHALRVKLAVPEAPQDYAWGDVFPHDVNMDQMGAIGFQKGCFVGQEVVSRMKHRGTARRRMICVQSTDSLPDTGADILANGKVVGALRSVSDHIGLAAVRIDKVKAAHEAGLDLTANGVLVILTLPDWVDFGWGA